MSLRAATAVLAASFTLFAARAAAAATCALGDHDGVDPVEAATAARVLCHELVVRAAPAASYEVRLGKLNGRVLVTVTEGGDESRQISTFVSGLDEVTVAAPRVASSLLEAKPLVETRDVENVLGEEGRAPKKVATVVGATVGTYAMSALGAPSSPSGGIDVGLAFRTGRLGLTGDGRLGGLGSGATKLSNASIDVGGRFYLTNGEHAPFVGAGVGLSSFTRHGGDSGYAQSGSGTGAFAAVGFEAMRSSHAGVVVAARLDLPFYSLERERDGSDYYADPGQPTMLGKSVYVAPISLDVALTFH